MARLNMPEEGSLTQEQKRVCEETAAGKRGKVPTPMVAWLRNPELARRGQRLGELLRFDTALGPRLTELAILICARHWTSHHEWKAHKQLALSAGLEPAVIAAIAAREPPPLSDREGAIILRVSQAMLNQGRLEASLYSEALHLLGEKALVELVATLGYYCMVSLTLNAFELGLPENVAPELNDPHVEGRDG
jgi:4-carboxymuconolactone decarboxylase